MVEGPPTYNNNQYQPQPYTPRLQNTFPDVLPREDQSHKGLEQPNHHIISQPHNNPQSSSNAQPRKTNIYLVENARMLEV